MVKVSTVRKLGTLARLAGDQAGRSRTVSALWKGCRATASHFGRVLHHLWLEVTGSVFLVLAIYGASKIVVEFGKYHARQTDSKPVWVAIGFTLMFGWFGLSSFWRVWKKP